MKHEVDLFSLSRNEERIINALQSANYVTYEKLISEVYENPDKEPEYSSECVKVFVHKLKKKLVKQGFTIESSGGGKGRIAKLRLKKL